MWPKENLILCKCHLNRTLKVSGQINSVNQIVSTLFVNAEGQEKLLSSTDDISSPVSIARSVVAATSFIQCAARHTEDIRWRKHLLSIPLFLTMRWKQFLHFPQSFS